MVLRSGAQGKWMRKTLFTMVFVGLVWVGYVLWPPHDLMRLTRAFETHDLGAVTRRVNFAAVRASLARQIVETYIKRANIKISPLAQGAAADAATSIVDPIVSRLVSPEALSALMTKGWPVTVVPERPASALGISSENLGTAWQLFANSEYGIGRFEVSVPAVLPLAQRFELQFRLRSWRWQLDRVTLPQSIADLLADELIKSLKQPSPVTP
jgi:hypothetical protein